MPTDVSTAPNDRRPAEETRDVIRTVGAALFAEHGFTATSVRDIAKAASTDPAQVIRYFGSKERLFLETMTVEGTFRAAVAGPVSELGETILRHLLTGAPHARRTYVALMGAIDRPDVRDYLARASAANLIDPLERRLTGPNSRLRAAAVAAQVNGLLNALWVLQSQELVAAPIDEVIRLYGASLQAIIEP